MKYFSLCLDIEVTRYNGPASVVGLYRPEVGGEIKAECLVRGRGLGARALKEAFRGCGMFITFNGISFDIPRLRREFGKTVVPGVKVFDVYRFMRQLLNVNVDLKTLENTMGVWRADERQSRRRQAVNLWQRFEQYRDEKALEQLIAYNAQDTINVYFLAEVLVQKAREKAKAGRLKNEPMTTQQIYDLR